MSATETNHAMEKHQVAQSQLSPDSCNVVPVQVLSIKPAWEKFGVPASQVAFLHLLEPDSPPKKMRAMLHGEMAILQACLDALSVQDVHAVQWLLTFFQNMLREDSSCYTLFEEALELKMKISKPLIALLDRDDSYINDVAAWILSAVMGHVSNYFSVADADALLSKILNSSACTELGKLDAIANVLKSDKFRASAWKHPSVTELVMGVDVETAQSQLLYKSVFATWLITFDKSLMASLAPLNFVARLRDIFTKCRVEKVLRISLIVVHSLLENSELSEQAVELNLLDAVQSLEFEKWRDADLYDDIREVSQQISNRVAEVSNFERYERELQSGKMTWSSVHTSKFWSENIMNFEKNNFRALKALAALLMHPHTDQTTLAVACRDVGEFCTRHPLGKKKLAELAIKDRIMELITLLSEEKRELRREALLCCQKIMLNNWQAVEAN
eukprot:TRINITY_DN3780_c0_g3_i1.p1 TRINITY_DN3780_c0_g3~~TRINITY_DN3780_c0_g3_i1.p1  ORF type:complete len:445 (+),score=127.48 TRINITY_DN3780_c0_g3_i1:71-1405(+)